MTRDTNESRYHALLTGTEDRFYPSRRRHRDEPETWEFPWTVRDRKTGAWYGVYATKAEAQAQADVWNAV